MSGGQSVEAAEAVLRQIVADYAEPVTSTGRDSLEQTVARLTEHMAQVFADRLAAIEWYTGKVPGYLAESYAAAIKYDDCPTAEQYRPEGRV